MSVLTQEARRGVDTILAAASQEGRTALFEHEVYGILTCLGLSVPRHLFIRDPRDVDEAALKTVGHKLVIKIVSAQVPHKQKVGGVRIVNGTDPLYVQFVMARMKEDVESHFPAEERPRIAGFLVVEFVPHTEALGYEVLIGFREDPAFGPALTVSKGGDDAEFFARNYDPANIFLPPMEYEDADALVRSLHIRHKFEQVGHPEYLSLMARAMAELSALAMAYSPLAERPRLVLKALEVNPFAISKDGRFVALDGLAEIAPAPAAEEWNPRVNRENLDAFFRPRGVAVVGVSSDRAKYSMARDIAELLHELHRKDLYLVNPRGGALTLGSTEYPLYTDISALPGPVDLAVYAAPAQNAPAFLRSLAPGRVRAVVLIPGVPSSVPYAEYTRQLRESVPAGIRIIGPNCMGVYHAATGGQPGVNTLFINEKRLEVRSSDHANAVLLTQSGALSVTLIDKLRYCRPLRSVVSFGNKFDVKVGDLLAHFSQDPAVELLAVYLEGLDPGEGRAFLECARQSTKPIVAYKGGRTEAGARSAASHTASMSGNYDVFKAACHQAGVLLTETIEEFYDLIRVFSLLAGRRPKGNRVAGVVNAGFESTVSADELKGLTQARLGAATVEKLNAINSTGLVDTHSPFLDITPMADDRTYAQFVEAVISDPDVDCVFVAVVPHAVTLKTVPETCRDPDALATLLVDISRRYAKPLAVSVNAGRHYADFTAALEEGGLPVYSDIRSAITSLDSFVSFCLGSRAPGRRNAC
ncbi:MAG TPA: acetate--CoA ligase family protein [Spirochaetia bacterium]|nr:acetate--CoA ligase family protein [Spirochaetia bacterium]